MYNVPTARNGSNHWTTKRERKRKSEERGGERGEREGGSEDQSLYKNVI